MIISVFSPVFPGEKYGSSSFRKKLKLTRISFATAGTYRVVVVGKYCQFEEIVQVKVVSKYPLHGCFKTVLPDTEVFMYSLLLWGKSRSYDGRVSAHISEIF